MALREDYDWESLVNDSERLVILELEKQLATAEGQCMCQDCVLDMAAFALNKVKPSYRVSLLGSVYAKQSAKAEHAEAVRHAVEEAIKKVHANPSHD